MAAAETSEQAVAEIGASMGRATKICIYGAGAVGGFMGARLARAGYSVSVVSRGATLQAIKARGLRLRSGEEEVSVPVAAAAEPEALGPQDYVIIAVKAPSLPEIVPKIGPLLGPETAVVTAMNGVPWWFFPPDGGPLGAKPLESIDPGGAIAAALPPSRAIGCVVHITCSQPEPGLIQHGFGTDFIIGEATGGRTSRLADLARCLEAAGLRATISDRIQEDVWIKLWGNMNMNPVSLLTEATTDRILDDPLVLRLCTNMMAEHAAVGAAIGIPIPMHPDERLAMARKLGPFKTSMLQDVEHRRAVELDTLLTVVREIGARVGVATPFVDAVLGLSRLRAASLGLYRRSQ